MTDNSALNETSHQINVTLRPSLKRKTFPDDTTRIIHRIKKKLLPNMELSFNTSVEIDDFIKDYVEIFEENLRDLTRHKRLKMLTVHELGCAIRLVLPPELAQRAMIAGETAVLLAKSSQPSDVSVEAVDIKSTSSKAPVVQKNTIEKKKSCSPGDLILSSDVAVEIVDIPSTYSKTPREQKNTIGKKKSGSPDDLILSSDVSADAVDIPPTSSKAPGDQKKLIRKKKSGPSDDINFGIYILRLKKLRQPDLQLSKESLAIINSILSDIIEQFQLCLRSLPRARKTLSVHDLECVTKLCLPPVLGDSAKTYGREAVERM